MKKLLIFMFSLAIFMGLSIGSTAVAYATADTVQSAKATAKSAYLIDYESGNVLYERDADRKLPIASMVKIMTLVLAFESIERGNLSLDQKITISDDAAQMGGSQMFLEANTQYTLSDLIKGISVCSANDASFAVGEAISGSKESFVDLMNVKAKQLGMNNTVFINMTGLPGAGQYSTAKDVSLMMSTLLKNSLYYDYSKILMENYQHPDGRITEMVNTNKLVRYYNGCDAGKTGFTNDALFCLSASAMRSGLRVIATVIGASESKTRFAEVSGLFNYAFANYKKETIVNSGDIINNTVEVIKGVDKKIELRVAKTISQTIKMSQSVNYSIDFEIPKTLKAPIKNGAVVGTIKVMDGNNLIGETDIIAGVDIDEMGISDAIKQILQNWFICRNRLDNAFYSCFFT
ncbi:MAG: D-alanyl-D-alanine carboxypeptidase [Christensenellaceae bacterium]|nr:D-alanyl-D-alanine carboxypeptidase [Christensenellaceae bacterium]